MSESKAIALWRKEEGTYSGTRWRCIRIYEGPRLVAEGVSPEYADEIVAAHNAAHDAAPEQDAVRAKALVPYASHLANCSLGSWDAGLKSCDCGLFALLDAITQQQEAGK